MNEQYVITVKEMTEKGWKPLTQIFPPCLTAMMKVFNERVKEQTDTILFADQKPVSITASGQYPKGSGIRPTIYATFSIR